MLKALITTLVVGTSAIASANPTFTANAQYTVTADAPQYWVTASNQPTYTVKATNPEPCDPPAPQPAHIVTQYHAPEYRPWVTLAGSLQLKDGRYDYVRVAAQDSRVKTLEFVNLGGKNDINGITIDFVGGHSQVVHIGQQLDSYNKSITVNVDNRFGSRIQRVVISGQSGRNASYELIAK